MFYLRYLKSELLRRRARTALTVLGLAVGVALVIVIAALTRGLDRAQDAALDPLGSIGTDLTVTRAAEEGIGRGPGLGTRQVLLANRSVLTDLSKLGKPGERFVHDFFLPGTQLTFAQREAKSIGSLQGVASVSVGLLLLAQHQEGIVPKIVAEFQTGGERLDVTRTLKPPTPAEMARAQACFAKSGGGGGGGGQRPAEPGLGLRGQVLQRCLPDRFRRFRASVTTPRETLRQVLAPPQTNIKTEPYTIAGVDQRRPGLALVTPAQVTRGRYLGAAGGREALLAATYASTHKLEVGSRLKLNETTFRVVGLVEPPLGGQTADVYLPLAQLQKLAGMQGLANIALVRARDSTSLGGVQRGIERALPDADVASAKQVADRINGSLVDAANLSNSIGLALAVIAAAAAFLMAALLTLSSVGKRVRELGTLKALGWTQGLVVRQVVGESLAQGLAGGVLGIGLGALAAALVSGYGPTLTAGSTTGGSLFGLGEIARAATREVSLTAPLTAQVLLLGLGLALFGGLLAGASGALRAARLRPAEAMRRVE